jgi:hypothetical protein
MSLELKFLIGMSVVSFLVAATTRKTLNQDSFSWGFFYASLTALFIVGVWQGY